VASVVPIFNDINYSLDVFISFDRIAFWLETNEIYFETWHDGFNYCISDLWVKFGDDICQVGRCCSMLFSCWRCVFNAWRTLVYPWVDKFFIAHVFYIIAFWNSFILHIMSKTSLLVALSLILFSIWFFLFLLRYVKEAGGVQLAIAVASYILVISIMMWSASLAGSSILIVASLLFVISDAILAYDKFRNPFSIAEHMVMITYFTAQLLFAISVGYM